MNEYPFIVYAIEAPKYPEQIVTDHIREEPLCYFDGTAVIISGGRLAFDNETGQEEPFIYQDGLPWHQISAGRRFVERVLAALIKPEDHILIYFHFIGDMNPEWAVSARESGMEIINGSRRGMQSGYSVCVGSGNALPTEGMFECCDTCGAPMIIASSDNENPFKRAMVQTARADGDMLKTLQHFDDGTHLHPERLVDRLRSQRFEMSMEGPDYSSLLITVSDTNSTCIGPIIQSIAASLDIWLFDAGKLSDPVNGGEPFYRYPLWITWSPLPNAWKRKDTYE